jgi:hypothetical protein
MRPQWQENKHLNKSKCRTSKYKRIENQRENKSRPTPFVNVFGALYAGGSFGYVGTTGVLSASVSDFMV